MLSTFTCEYTSLGVTLVLQCSHCIMEEEDILGEMSGDHSGSDPVTNTTDDHGVQLPAHLAYLLLGFRVISTTITVLLASWIFVTIMTTRSPNLMVIDMIYALIRLCITGTMIIGYSTGIGDFIGCNVYHFYFPIIVITLTFVMISVDKVIAVTLPLRHREIMKPRVVFGIITTIWVSAIVIFTHHLFDTKSFTKVANSVHAFQIIALLTSKTL